jgi:hypothetical protein
MSLAREFEGSRTNSLLLNGPWKFAIGTGDERAESEAGAAKLGWRQVTLPGPFIPWSQDAANHTKVLWAHRSFTVTPDQAHSLAVAQIGAEHTEAMRRARLDAILPYMYAGWTRTRQAARVRETGQGSAVWKAGYAAPESAAWHSWLSPVLASIDLFDANYRAGQAVTTDLHLINDSWHDAKVHVDLLMTRECPEYIPEAPCFDHPINQWSFEFWLRADSVEKVPVTRSTQFMRPQMCQIAVLKLLAALFKEIGQIVVVGVIRGGEVVVRLWLTFGSRQLAIGSG